MPKKPAKKPLTIETLKVQKTPDRKRQYWCRGGKQYGLGVNQFLYQIFCLNEDLPRMKKMTDEEIRRQIVVEYAHYKDTREYYSKTTDAIIEARMRFNRGALNPSPHKGQPPLRCSFRYNENGFALHRGKPISQLDKVDYYAHWTAIHLSEIGKFKEGTIIRDWMLDPNHPSVIKWYHRSRKFSNSAKEAWDRVRKEKNS